MGCLRNIINLVIIILAIIGFLSIGGKEYLDANVIPTVKKVNIEVQAGIDKTGKTFTELSLKEIGAIFWNAIKSTMFTKKVSGEYEITEVKGLMGYDTKIAEDIKTGQKMVLVDTKDKVLLDLNKTDKAELKADMLKLAKKHKALPVKFDDIDIVELGKWKALNKDLKYVKISIKDKSSNKEITAMISSYPDKDDTKMKETFAEKTKFSRKIAEKFFKKAP